MDQLPPDILREIFSYMLKNKPNSGLDMVRSITQNHLRSLLLTKTEASVCRCWSTSEHLSCCCLAIEHITRNISLASSLAGSGIDYLRIQNERHE